MQDTVNMIEVFNSMDKRRAHAEAVIAQCTEAQVAEASRIALLYSHSPVTSLHHREGIVNILTRGF
jgi:hypothetical protein